MNEYTIKISLNTLRAMAIGRGFCYFDLNDKDLLELVSSKEYKVLSKKMNIQYFVTGRGNVLFLSIKKIKQRKNNIYISTDPSKFRELKQAILNDFDTILVNISKDKLVEFLNFINKHLKNRSRIHILGEEYEMLNVFEKAPHKLDDDIKLLIAIEYPDLRW